MTDTAFAQRRDYYSRIELENRQPRQEGRAIALRDDDAGELLATGYAALYNDPYEVNDWLGSYTEICMPGCFDKTLAERADVRFMLNHEGLPLARTKSKTLELDAANAVGLGVMAHLERTDPDVLRIEPKMRRGDLTDMSFAFRATRQEWNEDYTERRLLEVILFDVALVTYAANDNAWMELNADELIMQLAGMDARELAQVRHKGALDPEIITRAVAVLEQLANGEGVDEPVQRDQPLTITADVAQRQLEVINLRRR